MRQYLRPIGSLTQFSDLADYLVETPFPAPAGFEWVTGEPPADAAPFAPLALSDQLRDEFENHLTPEQQADLAPLKAAVKLELDRDRVAIARLIIQRANIPPALEPIRQAMLNRFEAP